MLYAEQKGKLSKDGSLIHERSEDLLTSIFFQLISYVEAKDGLFKILSLARSAHRILEISNLDQDLLESIPVEKARSFRYKPWPSTTSGEPDFLVELLDENRNLLHTVIVEVKLDSGKSSVVSKKHGRAKDQLARYFQFYEQTLPKKASILYLTKHGIPPYSELESSIKQCKGIKLFWLSWLDVWRFTRENNRSSSTTFGGPIKDLQRILETKNLSGYSGVRELKTPIATPKQIFRRSWFKATLPLIFLRSKGDRWTTEKIL